MKAKAQSIPGSIAAASGRSSDEVERLRREISDLRAALDAKASAA